MKEHYASSLLSSIAVQMVVSAIYSTDATPTNLIQPSPNIVQIPMQDAINRIVLTVFILYLQNFIFVPALVFDDYCLDLPLLARHSDKLLLPTDQASVVFDSHFASVSVH